LIEAAQAHWRAGRIDADKQLIAQAVELGLRASNVAGDLPHAGEAFTVAGDAALDLWRLAPNRGRLKLAQRYAETALAATPDTLPRLGWRKARLAEKLMQVSNWEGTLAPLEEALGLLVDAPVETGDAEDRSAVFHDLSRAAGRRWLIAKEPADLDLSVDAAREAVRAMPTGSPERRYVESGLASALQRRGLHRDELKDLEEALTIRRRLVDGEREGPRRAIVKGNLARTLRAIGERRDRRDLLEQAVDLMSAAVAETPQDHSEYPKRLHDLGRTYRARGGKNDREAARACFEDALEAAADRPEVAAFAAMDLGQALEVEGRPGDAARQFDRSLRELAELQSRETRPADRISQLGRLRDVAAMAARAALLGRSSQDALEVVDRGRSIVLSNALDTRVRLFEGDFETGLLCVGATPTGGFALLTQEGGVATQMCPELTSDVVEAKSAALQAALVRRRRDPDAFANAVDRVTTWLGEALHLDDLDLPPRVSLVALGGLGRLPVHLARRGGGNLSLGHVVTMRMRLRKGQPRVVGVPRRGVFVAPESRRMSRLVLAQEEMRAMAEALHRVEEIKGPAATRGRVLGALDGIDVLHVAGHAESVPSRPMESRIFLSGDDVLTVADLLASPVESDIELVVLTGCETADIGVHAPDEVVGLVAGMIAAGAKIAISSQWPVSQVGAAFISRFFYESLAENPSDPAAGLFNAQRRMAFASDEELASISVELDAPVTDPGRLRQAVQWGPWTCMSL
jgi:tetratricopeptide (TPR) repeat protein